ncbi:MAG: penicillin-binding protein activator [bacterium]
MKRNHILSLLLTVLLTAALAPPASARPAPGTAARQDPQSDEPYEQALALYRQGRYLRAADILQASLQSGALGSRRASGWLLLAASHLGGDSPEAALQALGALEREFPDGPYILERLWLEGRAHARAGRYYEAAGAYARAVREGPEGRIGQAARDAFAGLLVSRLEPSDIQRLGTELSGSDLKAWLTLTAASELADRGDIGRARRLLERVREEEPTDGYDPDTARTMEDLESRLTRTGPSGLVLGVLTPLTGADSREGQRIVDAVRLAVGESEVDVRVAYRDTRGTLDGTVRGALALIRDEGAHILLGPCVEELALVAAGQAEGMDVPILLPFTQGSTPPALGENVFQLQAASRIQARYLADAAVDSMGFRTFAVLNPVTGSGPDFAETFMSRVEERGGSVIAHQVYFPETQDFQPQLEAIRREALRLSLADTTDFDLTDEEVLQEANRDTTGALVPVGSLDALVVPGISSEDVANIAVQANFFYFLSTLLGGATWNSYDVVLSGGNYVEGAIFTDAYSADMTSVTRTEYANRFYAAYQRQPERSAVFAYDAARLALAAWRMVGEEVEDQRTRRRRMRDWLAGVEAFEGAAGPVDLTRGRVNDTVFLLQILGGEIVPWYAERVEAGGGEGDGGP